MANDLSISGDGGRRGAYQRTMLEIASAFEAGASGSSTLGARSDAVDALAASLWAEACDAEPQLARNVALVATGGYGRRELFPYSDIDLMFLVEPKLAPKVFEATVKPAIRRISQSLWDCGLRLSPLTRKLTECERFDPENTEFALALLDQRFVSGDSALHERLQRQTLPKMFDRDRDAILRRLVEITLARHAKYGGTLFHLEPNVKECPGGYRPHG
jgi:[protein-PII] uridylyltransferase